MACSYIITQNLSVISTIISTKKVVKITLNQLIKLASPELFQGVLIIGQQIDSLSTVKLMQMDKIQHSLIIFVSPPNESSLFIIKNLFGWSELKDLEVVTRQSKYLPLFLFKNLPQIDQGIYSINNIEDLLNLKKSMQCIFSKIHLRSSTAQIFQQSQHFKQNSFSICSTNKLMQYLWLRIFRDLPL
jgi:hypothetical protein